MKKQANLKCVMVVQQLNSEFWIGWDKSIIDEANDGNIRPLVEKLVERLNNSGCLVDEAYGILHDKDEITVWDENSKENVTEFKTKHIHILIKMSKGDTINNLAVKIGVSAQYIEKAKSGRYGYDNLLAYLVHIKDESKYQYNPNEVITVSGEDYSSVYNRRRETWNRSRATKQAQETDLSVDYLIAQVLAGKLTKSQVLLTDEYYKVYALHKRKFNDAFDSYGENKSYRAFADIEDRKFKKTVIFVFGESGSGKTVLSKEMIRIIQSVSLKYCGSNWTYCLTASRNAFDEFNGQDILLLDDIRGDSLTASDWLKLLDPYTISPISARYHNKMGAAKVIIITSSKHPTDFFAASKGNYNEDLGQFFRRVDLLVAIEDDNFTLSKPIKTKKVKNKPIFLVRQPSHQFELTGTFKENKTLDKIIKTIIKNMQWNKKKPVT